MNLRDYWLIARRRRLIIIVSTALVMLFSFWFAKQKVPYFQASTAVKFEQSTQMSGLLVEVLSYSSADSIETQVTLIKSYPILEVEGRVKRAENDVWAFREANRIIAPGAESTVLLSIFTQVRGDIEKARQQRTELEVMQQRLSRMDPANTTERVFIDTANPAMQKLQATYSQLLLERNSLALEVTERHPRLQALDDRMREVRLEMRREVAAQIAMLRNREELLNRQIGELQQKNRELPTIELALQRLQREAKSNDELLGLLKTKHQEALIKEAEKIEEVAIVRPATEPETPIGGETTHALMIGGLLGLFLGPVFAFVRATPATSVRTIPDVQRDPA